MKTLIKPRPNHDVFGHCVLCHKNLLITQVVDGKELQRFKPNHGEVEYLLDDSTKMRVCMCKDCQEGMQHTDKERAIIMNCVIDGWKHEVETYSHWEQDKKDSYIKEYSKKRMVTHTKNKADDLLEEELKIYKLKEEKKRK